MNLKNEVEKRSAALPSSQLRRPDGRGTPEQMPPYPIGESNPKRTTSTVHEHPQHPTSVSRPFDLNMENSPQQTRGRLHDLPQHPAEILRPADPAGLQTNWQKPSERRNAETSPHSSKRPTDAGRTWFAKLLPLLVGAVGLGTILLLLHIIHTLF